MIKTSLRGNRTHPPATLRGFFFFTMPMLFRNIKKEKYIYIYMQNYKKPEKNKSLNLSPPFFFFFLKQDLVEDILGKKGTTHARKRHTQKKLYKIPNDSTQ